MTDFTANSDEKPATVKKAEFADALKEIEQINNKLSDLELEIALLERGAKLRDLNEITVIYRHKFGNADKVL